MKTIQQLLAEYLARVYGLNIEKSEAKNRPPRIPSDNNKKKLAIPTSFPFNDTEFERRSAK